MTSIATATATSSYYASFSAPRSAPRSQPAAWQMVILPRPATGAGHPAPNAAADLRFDSAHAGLTQPHFPLNWSDLVGVHPASSLDPTPQLVATSLATRSNQSAAASSVVDRAAVQELLAEAAHEVRSPIAGAIQALMMVTQRAAGQPLDTRELQLLQAAQVRLLHANRWAEDILAERSLNQRALPNVRRRFYPDQWRQELLPIVQTTADKNQVQLLWEGWDRSLPRMYMDANHLSRVVMNLVINAVQASPKGESVSIRAAAQSNVSQRLLISIEDHGIGLDASTMRRLNSSQAWSEEESTANRSHGLGLRTVKTLVEAMGGSISVQRGAQGGTLFRLAFPVDDLRLLVRQWMMRLAVEQGLDQDAYLAVYALGVTDMDEELVDRHLQRTATPAEFIYRFAKSQWMSLRLVSNQTSGAADVHSLASKLNEFGRRTNQHARCQADLVCKLVELPFANRGTHDDAPRLRAMLDAIHSHAQRLMDGRVPPLDLITTVDPVPLAHETVELLPTELHNPIAAPAKAEGAARTIQEVAKQWRMIHSKLEQLHNRHLRSAPAM